MNDRMPGCWFPALAILLIIAATIFAEAWKASRPQTQEQRIVERNRDAGVPVSATNVKGLGSGFTLFSVEVGGVSKTFLLYRAGSGSNRNAVAALAQVQ